MSKIKKTYRQSELDLDAALLATALKAAGQSFKFDNGITQPSDDQKISALEKHIEALKQHRYDLANEHGHDANNAIQRLNSEISRAIEMIAKLKIKATEPV